MAKPKISTRAIRKEQTLELLKKTGYKSDDPMGKMLIKEISKMSIQALVVLNNHLKRK